MKTVKFKNDVIIRECNGCGCFSLLDDNDNYGDLRPIEIMFAITGIKGDYTLSFASGSLMISTLLNSDHILIMKQILKEMGEI